jgi:flagellar hook-associated protein 3 FlgL
MRVTANTFPTAVVDQISKLAARQYRLQTEATTGQRIQSPEDDPAAMRRVLGLKLESKSLVQYRRNIATLKEYATASYSAIKGLKTISDRAGELALKADDLTTPEQRRIMATEVNQLLRQAVQSANAKYRGDYLFAGTQTDQAPFSITTDADGWVTEVAYRGNASVTQAEIAPNDLVAAKVPGANTTGSGPNGLVADSRTGADLFQHLIDLQNHLRDGDVDEIANTDRANLARDEENLLRHFSSNSALQARLETAESLAASRGLDLAKSISQETDADLAQTLIRLNETQTAYRIALQTGATLIGSSLLDYLR